MLKRLIDCKDILDLNSMEGIEKIGHEQQIQILNCRNLQKFYMLSVL